MDTIAFDKVRLKDPVVSVTQNLISDFVLDHQWKIFTGQMGDGAYSPSIDNYRVIAGEKEGEFNGNIYQGGDLAKWLEGAAIKLTVRQDAVLEGHVDEVIRLLEKAQQEDGYLGAYYQLKEPGKQFTNLTRAHELFFYGHLAEAAIAYHKATGKRRLLDIVLRFTDLIEKIFGEDACRGYDGHPECEIALMRLYEHTGQARFLKLAKFFVDVRGEQPAYYQQEYIRKHGQPMEEAALAKVLWETQSDHPLREVNEISGHAVRALYLAAGMADVARATDDEALWQACLRWWDSTTKRKMYFSGGVGSTRHCEAFGSDYDLPNDRTYQETCAAIGLVYFAFAMLRRQPKGEYADVIEQCVYNCILSAMSFDGTRFLYVNPLETWPPVHGTDRDFDSVKPVRQRWYRTACCPPNLARFIPSIGSYVYTTQADKLYVHLYMANDAQMTWQGKLIGVRLEGNYPWEGDVIATLSLPEELCGAIALRIPGWCENTVISVNGERVQPPKIDGYAHIERVWKSGDTVSVTFDMTPRAVMANPRVMADAGKVAVLRGPVLYCAEEQDNGQGIHNLRIAPEQGFDTEWVELEGHRVVGIKAQGACVNPDAWGDGALYRPYARREEAREIRLIPYYTWGNRRQDAAREMRVWLLV